MKKKILSLLVLVMTVMTASAFDLKVGTNEHGTIAFTVNGQSVTSAAEGDVVTVTVTPAEGWSVGTVTGQWYAAIAAAPRRAASIDLLKDFELTAVEGQENQWTFTMQRANAEISATYRKLLTHTDITIEDIEDVTYNGEEHTPTVVVKDGNTTLTEGTDYTVTYSNNVNACEATAENAPTVTITGMGDYDGTVTVTFTIEKAQPVVTFLGEEEYDELLKEPFESPVATIDPEGLPIVYSSSDVEVATVDPETGEVTFTGIGVVTITAAFEGNDNYEPAEDSYTIYIEHRVFTIDFTKEPNKGSVTLSAKKAIEYDEITVSVLPDAGYVITEVEVVTDGGETVEYTEAAGENEREVVYIFSMPYDNVTVNVKFENKNVEGREVTTGDGNTYVVTDPDAQTVIVKETDPDSNVIVIPATIYDEETGVEYTVTGVDNDAFEGRGTVTDVYVENEEDMVEIDGQNFVEDMPDAKLHVYQTLLGDYADAMPELLDGHKLVTDIENTTPEFTFSNATNVLLPEGVQQFICQYQTTSGNAPAVAAAPAAAIVKATLVPDQVVTAHNGVMLQGETGVKEYAAVKDAGNGNYEGNELKAIEKATVINHEHGAYMLEGKVWEHIWDEFVVIGDGKAILLVKDGTNLPDELEYVLDTTTGIQSIDNSELTSDKCYSIQGYKVTKSQSNLPKGVYIVNGKKVVMK